MQVMRKEDLSFNGLRVDRALYAYRVCDGVSGGLSGTAGNLMASAVRKPGRLTPVWELWEL